MNDPIVFDISASSEANEQALLGALLSGQPLTILDSSEPEIPALQIGMELSRAEDGAEQ
jgi:hypothetical protein